jgi:hypothetical protein
LDLAEAAVLYMHLLMIDGWFWRLLQVPPQGQPVFWFTINASILGYLLWHISVPGISFLSITTLYCFEGKENFLYGEGRSRGK